VSVSDDVLEALSRPVPAHYGDDWVAFNRRLSTSLADVFRTRGDVILLFGPASAAIEAALASTLARGDEVLIVANGVFGQRLVEIATAVGLVVHSLPGRPRQPFRAEELADAVRAYPGARGFAVVHHETGLGMLNPVRELAAEARRHDLLTIVDAVASVGGVPLEMDEWGIDLCVGTGNKCLGAPPGIAPVAVGARGWEAVDDGRPKAAGWYLNLATWKWYLANWGSWHPSPTTMPSSVMVALNAAVEGVLSAGLEAHQARFARASGRVREGLRELGFEMVIPDEHASPVTTAVWGRSDMDVADYMSWLRQERGLRIGGGLGDLAGRSFRVGHMGLAAEPEVVGAYLEATEDYLTLRTRLTKKVPAR
jgi:alanine-glyoxylate transaminase/serine-glyoxylate transaminase/serine-pyruvate transaminase